MCTVMHSLFLGGDLWTNTVYTRFMQSYPHTCSSLYFSDMTLKWGGSMQFQSRSEKTFSPLQPKRLRRTCEKTRRGAEVHPLLSLITSSQPPWSHGNRIPMVTHHSNRITMLKSSRNASTQFTFLTAPVNERMGAQSCCAITIYSRISNLCER